MLWDFCLYCASIHCIPLKRHSYTCRGTAVYIACPFTAFHSRGILILAVGLLPILRIDSLLPLKRHNQHLLWEHSPLNCKLQAHSRSTHCLFDCIYIYIFFLLATARLANIATNGLVTILLSNVSTINYYHYHYHSTYLTILLIVVENFPFTLFKVTIIFKSVL